MPDLLTPARVDEEELLDEHDAPRPDMERSLRDLRRINKYLGGVQIYRKLVRKVTGPGAIVADVGAGTCDLLESLRDARMKIGVDFNISHLLYLRHGSRVHRVVGDATMLPFRDGSVDILTSSHFFHHFDAAENEQILDEALRVVRKGVAISDTQRHHIPLLFVRLLGALRLVGRITRFDAPASVLRGYTTREARAVAERTAARKAQVVSMWPFRFGIMLWK